MHKRWNADEIDRLSTHRERNEVIAGERFVQPPQSSTHQQAIIRLATWLLPYCDAMSLTLIIARAEVRFGEFDRVEPDLFVIPRAADGRRAGSFADVGRLLLVVEVVSPGTAIVDRVQKRELYRAHGVPEYWVVDAENRVVERLTPASEDAEIVGDAIEWRPVEERDAIRIELATYFRCVCDG